MKTKSIVDLTNDYLQGHSGNVLFDRKSKLPLSQQAQLASDALIVSRLLELLNDIEVKPEIIKTVDITRLEDGMQIIEKLKKGDDYLSQHKTRLMQRPEATDTVDHIKRRTGLHISEQSEVVLAVLKELKDWPKSQSILDNDKLQLAKHYLRDIHTGIMDQLDASDEIDMDL